MSTGLVAGITWIQATLRTLPGLRAPILPPQSIVEYPTAIVYEGSGTWTTEAADQYKYLGTLLIDMPIPAVDFETGLRSLRPFIEALPKIILADTSLGHAVSTFGTAAILGAHQPDRGGAGPADALRLPLDPAKYQIKEPLNG